MQYWACRTPSGSIVWALNPIETFKPVNYVILRYVGSRQAVVRAILEYVGPRHALLWGYWTPSTHQICKLWYTAMNILIHITRKLHYIGVCRTPSSSIVEVIEPHWYIRTCKLCHTMVCRITLCCIILWWPYWSMSDHVKLYCGRIEPHRHIKSVNYDILQWMYWYI